MRAAWTCGNAMIKTLCILPVLAVLGMLSAADAQVTDTTPPSLVSATVHPDTRVLTVEFDEPVEINSNYLGIFFIPLSEVVEPHRATVDSNIVTVTVSQTSVDIIEADGLIHGQPGAIADLSANAFNQHEIPVTLEPTLQDTTIGALIPQTGRNDDAGEHRTLATEFAVADFNRYLEGKGATWRLSVDIRDTGANNATALEQAKSLHAGSVTLISGPSASSGVSAIKPYADANDMIIVSCCSTSPALAVAGDNIFRLAADDSLHGPVIADLIRTDGKEVLIPVWRDDIWGNGLYQSTADAFEALGGTVDASVGSYDACENVPSCYDADFAGRVAALDDAVAMHSGTVGADKIVVLFIGYGETADFVREAAEYPALRQVHWVGSDANVLASPLVEEKAVFDFLVDVNFRSCIFAEDTTSRQYMDLEARFDDALESTPNVYAYSTYDTIWVIGLAIEAAGAGGGFDEIKRQIPLVASGYVGMLGDIELNGNGDLDESSYAVYGIEESGWVHIGTYVPGTGLVERSQAGGGSDSEWEKRPTFGRSDLTHNPIVSCGYSMDGQCRDVMDYHVDYKRETIQTSSVHNFTLRAYSPISHMAQFQIAFGVPEVGAPMSEAEATIIVDLVRNYTDPSTYQIEGVSYVNRNNVIGTDATASVGLVRCMEGFEADCVELSIDGVMFREQMHHEPFVIFAMDRDRRTATHYMNEGIAVRGESLNPAPMAVAGIKKSGNQHQAEPINLVRTDKLGDLWEDQWGNAWARNDHGTWRQLTPETFERVRDGAWSVMTRMNSNFAALVQHEMDRATLVWDGSEIQGVHGGAFAHDLGGGPDVPRLERLAGLLASESSRAQALLDQMTQDRAHNTWK